MSTSLVSTQTRVESPFIIVKIGDYTFGHCEKNRSRSNLGSLLRVVYPNFMESLSIVKINGAVNTYTINMIYGITEADDPNLLEKVFSSVSNSREIRLSYGDWNAPAFIYKEEEAIITKITSNVDFKNSQIKYVIHCTSKALSLKAGTFSFPARTDRPSDVIFELLGNKGYNLHNIFPGMASVSTVRTKGLIASDDKKVKLEAKKHISILDYIAYLVSCMTSINDKGGTIKKENYYWAVYDDLNNEFGGSYFKVIQVTAGSQYSTSYNTYEVDVGYPSGSYVTNFTLNQDESWAILYNYSKNIDLPQYTYTIDKKGDIVESFAPSLTSSSKYLNTTTADRAWWSQMTQFPITAKLTIKGLLRPALLMSYVKVNTYFYGHKHISSGLYIITKQEDSISTNGYSTTLSLTRLSGDENERP